MMGAAARGAGAGRYTVMLVFFAIPEGYTKFACQHPFIAWGVACATNAQPRALSSCAKPDTAFFRGGGPRADPYCARTRKG